jgi:PadR family transcriptional regulator
MKLARVRMSPQTVSLLAVFLLHPKDWRYGYEMSRETGIKSGTLYPILMRLEGRGWLETRWEDPREPGKPPRHMYRLTPGGLEMARDAVPAKMGEKWKTRRALSAAGAQ